MKTDDLISLLAADAGPAPRALPARRVVAAGVIGGIAALGLCFVWLGFISWKYFLLAGPWMKLVYGATLSALAVRWAIQSGKPAAKDTSALSGIGMVVLLVLAFGAWFYMDTPVDERPRALLGHSYLMCPWHIVALSVPVLASAFWALKGLAPTALGKSGAACGLLAGAIGATAYALACTETSLTFIAVWYSAGIALTTLLGYALGPRLLRW